MWDDLFDCDFPDSDSDSDSNLCDDEFGLAQLFGDKKPDMELPPSGSPRAYSWSDDDSGCDNEDITVPVEKSDDANSELEFVKVLMALSQPCAVIMLYLTFEFKDLADGGTIKIYQAVVWWTVDDVKVLSFRLKPPEDEQEGSGNHGNEWFWKGH
ncbi:hypothetical protein RHSIM_Rhsim08G0121300 [Rhododendron simsii]|uniref:Uncharacterized protein n=1 Tax=Rhododendron simsii TaxID=118357 RepID=A0A834GII1_RHOSS|nr:hypothetical protein RHSIM_Rhsim08G0121300 [Rhododendron simsii]